MRARLRKVKKKERVSSGMETLTGTQSPALQHGGQAGPEDCWVLSSTDYRLTWYNPAKGGPWEVQPDITCAHGTP